MQVNSAVRTVEFQQHLAHINGNAAPAEGDTASPHLTGQAIDIAKHGLSLTEIAWLRGYLLPLVQEGKIDVEEEFQQSCFHISVYKKYLPSRHATRPQILATSHHSENQRIWLPPPLAIAPSDRTGYSFSRRPVRQLDTPHRAPRIFRTPSSPDAANVPSPRNASAKLSSIRV